ncbi:hypothetical protein CJ481_22400 [Bacillus subtilis]|nr:hypothetical protein CJ481_22400 [Bacillus subtilis]
MINELTEKYGKDIISEMIKETAKKGDFKKGFKSATKESLDQFEKDFKNTFEENRAALDSIYPMPLLLMKSLLAHAALSWGHLPLCRSK